MCGRSITGRPAGLAGYRPVMGPRRSPRRRDKIVLAAAAAAIPGVAALVEAGAPVLRKPGCDIRWHVGGQVGDHLTAEVPLGCNPGVPPRRRSSEDQKLL